MSKNFYNIYVQCFLFTLVWQIILSTLYLADLITYNPLIEISDILPNYFFIFLISLIFLSPLFSLILLSLIYFLGGLLYFFTRQNITLTQIYNLPELIAIYNPYSFFIIIIFILVIYLLYTVSIKLNTINLKSKTRLYNICLCFFLLSMIGLGPKYYFPIISKHNTENFNKFATWKHGGQLYSIIYHYADKNNMLHKLKEISKENINDISSPHKFKKKLDVDLIMIILLESFVPRSDLQPKKFKPFLKDLDFESVILETPAYGGYSAKSEFEILCGLPELQPFGDMTFNYFGGNEIDFCLPSVLSKLNFQTLSITGTGIHFHNAKKSYSSIGFSKSISKKDLDNNDLDGRHPSDKTIYERAYKEILNREKDKLFLYVFTAAGHSPYKLNKKNRPKLTNDIYLDRVTYSEKELIEFLKKINSLNIKKSIVIAGDHATESSIFNRNKNLLTVWYKSDSLNDFDENCSQYYQIPKFFTNQRCLKINTDQDKIIGRGKNFSGYDSYNEIIMKLIKNSQK